MPSTPDTSELPPTTGQAEGFSVPKPSEAKPPEQPISPGAQRIIDSIRKAQGVPREVLGEIAGEKPAPKKIIDMVKGSDGKLRAIVTSEPENPAASVANPQAPTGENPGNAQYQQINRGADEAWVNIQQATSGRPGVRAQPPSGRPPNWETPPNFSAAKPASPQQRENITYVDKEAEKPQELQKLQSEGVRLATLVYTPEGQQQIAGTRARLVQIVEATSRKTYLEAVVENGPGYAQRVEQLRQAWLQSNEVRVEKLLRGEDMDSFEVQAYLTSVLGQEQQPIMNQAEKLKKKDALLGLFNRLRRDIGRALLYQSSEAKPIGQRHLLLSEGTLKWHGITTSEAQENFAKGWEGVKAQSLQQSQGRPKL